MFSLAQYYVQSISCPEHHCEGYIFAGAAIGLIVFILAATIFVSIRNHTIKTFGGEQYMRGWKDACKDMAYEIRVIKEKF